MIAVTKAIVIHLRAGGQFMGLLGSVGPFQSGVPSFKTPEAASSPSLRCVLAVVLMIGFDQGVRYMET